MNSGQHIQQADLVFARPGNNQGDFYTINLADVQVRSYQVTTAKDGTLLEEYTLNFARGAESYKPQKPDDTLDAPVTFTENGLAVTHAPIVGHSPLQDGFVTPPGLSLFLDVNGIPGESTANAHPDEIDLLAFSWGGELQGGTSTGGGGGAGKTVFQQLHFVSRISKASPTLLSRVLSGQHVPDATFTVQRKSSGQDFLKIRLQDVLISSYQVTTAIDGTVTEEFTLTFGPGGTTGPIADAGGPYTVPDNGTVQLDASASTDPNPASLTYAWDLDGDGIFGETGADAARGDELGINPTFNAAGIFGPAIFNIDLRITDGAGLTDTASTSVRVIDVTPPDTIILTGPASLTNQTSATFTFTGTDQGTPADQLTFTASVDGGTPFAVTSPLTLTNLADGAHTLSVVATDQAGNTDPTPAVYTWKVDTVGPNILNPLATPSPVSVGVPITLTATASDLLTGASNIAGAQYSLDGMTWINLTAADGAFNSPSEAIKANLAPLPAGIYTISVRATDAAGNTGPISSITLPVFDRDAGKINGGGSFDSPAGADPLHPTQTGKAEVEIEAQYKKNDTVPSGKVKFKFGDLKFESTAVDYLVITNGNAARLAGSGQINGQGNYAFEISFLDGNPGKGAGNDFFRIRITDKTTGQLIYDNGLTAPISAPPQTLLKSGNIKVID
jgi:type VI protein secretion system component Hcp